MTRYVSPEQASTIRRARDGIPSVVFARRGMTGNARSSLSRRGAEKLCLPLPLYSVRCVIACVYVCAYNKKASKLEAQKMTQKKKKIDTNPIPNFSTIGTVVSEIHVRGAHVRTI